MAGSLSQAGRVAGPVGLVSIGLPVHNGERFLGQALASLCRQTHGDFELIISDNASTDRTGEICRAAADGDPRIRYTRNEINLGAPRNFAKVLDLARGEMFMWASCDDLWEPRFIESLAGALRSSPGAVAAFCGLDSIDERGRSVRDYPHLFDLPSPDPVDRLDRYIAQPEHLGKANIFFGLMRRGALVEAGGLTVWSERIWGMDMLVVFRLLSFGELVLGREILFHKRLLEPVPAAPRTGGVVSRLREWREGLRERRDYFRGYERLIDLAPGLSGGDRDRLRATVRRRYSAVRREALSELRRNARHRVSRALRGTPSL